MLSTSLGSSPTQFWQRDRSSLQTKAPRTDGGGCQAGSVWGCYLIRVLLGVDTIWDPGVCHISGTPGEFHCNKDIFMPLKKYFNTLWGLSPCVPLQQTHSKWVPAPGPGGNWGPP